MIAKILICASLLLPNVLNTNVIVKHLSDQVIVNSPTCGEVREILRDGDFKPLGIAVAIDIRPTVAHFHRTFEEIYFVLDGEITLKVYDPKNDQTNTYKLKGNELVVIPRGVHHKIIKASKKNRLCVISTPPFHADDEIPSDKL